MTIYEYVNKLRKWQFQEIHKPRALQANSPMAVWSLSGLTACTTSSCWNRLILFSITDGNSFSHSLLREKLDHSEPSSKFNTWYSLGKLVCNHWKIMSYLRNFRIKILRDIESNIRYWHWIEYSVISCMYCPTLRLVTAVCLSWSIQEGIPRPPSAFISDTKVPVNPSHSCQSSSI